MYNGLVACVSLGGIRMSKNGQYEDVRRRMIWSTVAALSLFFLLPSFVVCAAPLARENLLGVKEGWAWPVVVCPPPTGWESPRGEAIKLGLRAAERELSLQRKAIRGKEATFMFSSARSSMELAERLETWRAMKVAVILSFSGEAYDETLVRLCASRGPSVIFANGEGLVIKESATGKPYPYLFALDLHYYARANALSELALRERPLKKVAVITDPMSVKLAKGADLNAAFLKSRGLETLFLSVSGLQQDRFEPQLKDVETGGIRVVTSWLDAMATLSIWKTLSQFSNGSKVYYAGRRQRILMDAENLVLVDKDVLLERNEAGRHGIIIKIRDFFDKTTKDPVLSAKAYALGRWVIKGYIDSRSSDAPSISRALAQVRDIPLMDEMLAVDPRTHRPKSRRFGVLRIASNLYKSDGHVEVFSVESGE